MHMELVYALSQITEMRKQYFVGLLSLLLLIDVYMWACKLGVWGNDVLESNGGYIDEKNISISIIIFIRYIHNKIGQKFHSHQKHTGRIIKQMYTPYAN